jgi:hypothetical protein
VQQQSKSHSTGTKKKETKSADDDGRAERVQTNASVIVNTVSVISRSVIAM